MYDSSKLTLPLLKIWCTTVPSKIWLKRLSCRTSPSSRLSVFLASIGIHESAWGTSKIANDKNNLFGFTAYDSDPYNSATSFDNYENAINKVAEVLSTKYLHVAGTKISDELTATGTYFNGTSAKSVNVRYASDTGWADKVFNYMQYLYNKL